MRRLFGWTLWLGVPLLVTVTSARAQEPSTQACAEARSELRAAGLAMTTRAALTAGQCRDVVVELVPALWRVGPSNSHERERLLQLSTGFREPSLVPVMTAVALDTLRSRDDRVSAMMAITATTVKGYAVMVYHDAEPEEVPVGLGTAHHPRPLRNPPTQAECAAIKALLDRIAQEDHDPAVRGWAKVMWLSIETRSRWP